MKNESATALSDHNATVVQALMDEGDRYWAEGSTEEALEAWQWAAQLDPDNESIREKLSRHWASTERGQSAPEAGSGEGGIIHGVGGLTLALQQTSDDEERPVRSRFGHLRAVGELAPPRLTEGLDERRKRRRQQAALRKLTRRLAWVGLVVLILAVGVRGLLAVRRGETALQSRQEMIAAIDDALARGDWQIAGALGEALGQFEDAQTRALSYFYQGRAVLMSGDAEQAIPQFELAMSLDRASWEIPSALAEALAASGQKDSALALYRATFTRFGDARGMWGEYADLLRDEAPDVAAGIYCLMLTTNASDSTIAVGRLSELYQGVPNDSLVNRLCERSAEGSASLVPAIPDSE